MNSSEEQEDLSEGCYSSFFTSRNLTSECLEATDTSTPALPSWTLSPLLLLLVVTLLANAIVVLTWVLQPTLRTPPNLHILSLATVDLLIAVASMPVHFLKMTGNQQMLQGTLLCEMWLTMDIFLTNISVFNLVNIALDRFQAVWSPLAYSRSQMSLTRPRVKAVAAWTVGLGFAVPILWARLDSTTCGLKLAEAPWLTVYLPLVCFFLPLLIIATLYTAVFVTMIRQMRQKRAREALSCALHTATSTLVAASTMSSTMTSLLTRERVRKLSRSHDALTQDISRSPPPFLRQRSKSWDQRTGTQEAMEMQGLTIPSVASIARRKLRIIVRKERRLALVMCLLIGGFIACYLPFWSVFLCLTWIPSCPPPSPLWQALVSLLALSCSLVNPLLYTAFHREYRMGMRNTLVGICQGCFNVK